MKQSRLLRQIHEGNILTVQAGGDPDICLPGHGLRVMDRRHSPVGGNDDASSSGTTPTSWTESSVRMSSVDIMSFCLIIAARTPVQDQAGCWQSGRFHETDDAVCIAHRRYFGRRDDYGHVSGGEGVLEALLDSCWGVDEM